MVGTTLILMICKELDTDLRLIVINIQELNKLSLDNPLEISKECPVRPFQDPEQFASRL